MERASNNVYLKHMKTLSIGEKKMNCMYVIKTSLMSWIFSSVGLLCALAPLQMNAQNYTSTINMQWRKANAPTNHQLYVSNLLPALDAQRVGFQRTDYGMTRFRALAASYIQRARNVSGQVYW